MKKVCILLSVLMCCGAINAQSCLFFSGNEHTNKEITDTTRTPMENKSTQIVSLKSFLSSLTLPELEFVTNNYLTRHPLTKNNSRSNKNENSQVLSMYNGNNHELSIGNLLDVMEEVGVTNKLFVVAQSMLETGYFKSNACKNFHNLFGLMNPHTGKLYQFDCWESSVVAYKKFVQYKYKGGSYLSFLKRIGYAEDPRYISKVVHISRQINKEMNIID